ncbi:MAG TPA: biopolymer transporter ExbD [Bacteroidota bacterium]|nr:biopolymer transporter ExbD [Bacteroidota bacterium]
MLKKRSASRDVEIPTSSMADISFLLLLFFLVTTTIDVDTGIGLVLPPPVDDAEQVKVKTENLIRVLVNARGDVLLDDELTSVPQINEIVKNKIKANDKLIVSVKVDRETPYRTYIATLDQIKQAYNALREEYAQTRFGVALKDVTKEQLEEIREKVPQRISLAEPERTR